MTTPALVNYPANNGSRSTSLQLPQKKERKKETESRIILNNYRVFILMPLLTFFHIKVRINGMVLITGGGLLHAGRFLPFFTLNIY